MNNNKLFKIGKRLDSDEKSPEELQEMAHWADKEESWENWVTPFFLQVEERGSFAYGELKGLIRMIVHAERETAVKEFCQKLNDQGLGEDEEFKRFCEEWGKVFKPVV